uniref:Vacuolar fusion protein mon1 a-like n=1 Tax=Tetraselmis sp. GSL018 TaxID=582737 RepID=A0A061RDL2_9CHLO|mmetsp:Transcript_21040/g.50220  ORF Transcript_21040/g.50220 Transcript_21040/m.50220 type:complete len:935 (+) Transcript_21040:134-2938(+)
MAEGKSSSECAARGDAFEEDGLRAGDGDELPSSAGAPQSRTGQDHETGSGDGGGTETVVVPGAAAGSGAIWEDKPGMEEGQAGLHLAGPVRDGTVREGGLGSDGGEDTIVQESAATNGTAQEDGLIPDDAEDAAPRDTVVRGGGASGEGLVSGEGPTEGAPTRDGAAGSGSGPENDSRLEGGEASQRSDSAASAGLVSEDDTGSEEADDASGTDAQLRAVGTEGEPVRGETDDLTRTSDKGFTEPLAVEDIPGDEASAEPSGQGHGPAEQTGHGYGPPLSAAAGAVPGPIPAAPEGAHYPDGSQGSAEDAPGAETFCSSDGFAGSGSGAPRDLGLEEGPQAGSASSDGDESAGASGSEREPAVPEGDLVPALHLLEDFVGDNVAGLIPELPSEADDGSEALGSGKLFSGSEDDGEDEEEDEFFEADDAPRNPWLKEPAEEPETESPFVAQQWHGISAPESHAMAGDGAAADASGSGSDPPPSDRLAPPSTGQPSREGKAAAAPQDAGRSSNPDPTSDPEWQAMDKHFFVLSSAGKPIFSRYGGESSLAGFMGVVCGMLSFMESSGDRVQSMRAGCHLFVFLCQGPIYLVAVSRTGEPVRCLLLQLELLYHSIISILTNAVERIFRRSPSYDMRQLMGGTGTTMRTLIGTFARDPSPMMVSISAVPLASALRRTAQDALAEACASGGAMYGLLLAGGKCAAAVEPRGSPLHPHDVLLLANFVSSNDSFRQAESFAPVCLPHFNCSAYLHAYIHYIGAEVCVVLLAPNPELFPKLAEARAGIESSLSAGGVMEALRVLMEEPYRGALRIDQLPKDAGGGAPGSTPLWHFVYRLPARRQALVAAFTSPLARESAQEAAVREYSSLAARIHNRQGLATHKTHFATNDTRTLLVFASPEYELFATFDPLTERSKAVQVSCGLATWIRANQSNLFIPLGS